MSTTSVDITQDKELLKEVIVELFQERRDLFYDLFQEMLEDIALVNAIQTGETSETVSRAEVFQVLEGAA